MHSWRMRREGGTGSLIVHVVIPLFHHSTVPLFHSTVPHSTESRHPKFAPSRRVTRAIGERFHAIRSTGHWRNSHANISTYWVHVLACNLFHTTEHSALKCSWICISSSLEGQTFAWKNGKDWEHPPCSVSVECSLQVAMF